MASSSSVAELSVPQPITVDPRPSKKRFKTTHKPSRKKRCRSKLTSSIAPPQPFCALANIPLELLAEILSHVSSTKEILALARTSKYFCHTLVADQTSGFIWRKARENAEPEPIPPPTTPNWVGRESAYAAFLWDGGECEICKKHTPKMYTSFSLRVRLCGNGQCMTAWNRTLNFVPAIEWIPALESNQVFIGAEPNVTQYYPQEMVFHRRGDYDAQALEDCEAALNVRNLEDLTKLREKEARKMTLIMELAVQLFKWKEKWTDMKNEVKKRNEALLKATALREGWEYWDLKSSQTFGLLLRTRNSSLEDITEADLDRLLPTISTEIFNTLEHRKRGAAEAVYRKHCEAIAAHYQRLRSSESLAGRVMPSLQEFRRLPVVKVVQSRRAAGATVNAQDVNTGVRDALKGVDLAAELKSKTPTLLSALIMNEVQTWRDAAESLVCQKLLGYTKDSEKGEWRNLSKNKLNPVERLDARFNCKKCGKTSGKYVELGCLDFSGVCSHSCIGLDEQGKGAKPWSVEQFEVDKPAVQAVTELLKVCGVEAEDPNSISAIKALGNTILCLSCKNAPIVMNFDNLLRHCRRHAETQLQVLTNIEAEAILRQHPLTLGLHAKITDPSWSNIAKRTAKVFGCRHCVKPSHEPAIQPRTAPEVQPEAESGEIVAVNPDTLQIKPQKKVVLWDYNALRSHMKGKHSLEQFGDEDFFMVEGGQVW
ncbi:hypothetical protein JAAARDRAFT_78089 [Jaapia argillacea MUCL 33604]|uniref:F-box domain-containing protein n=1 Tax=Jaapia argillacea MUCL 33604 TaxID=933084 RepID=A0A067PZN1_9AGAM|nr:hypothetical protein JAAARDRAFT_78089 [Jaapia argillacea MUCL 33604]